VPGKKGGNRQWPSQKKGPYYIFVKRGDLLPPGPKKKTASHARVDSKNTHSSQRKENRGRVVATAAWRKRRELNASPRRKALSLNKTRKTTSTSSRGR